MKKIIKKGLGILGTTACALTFAYAQSKTETPRRYTLEEKAEAYEQYCLMKDVARGDNKLTYKEILELHGHLEKHLPHMPNITLDSEIMKIRSYLYNNGKSTKTTVETKTDNSEKENFDKIIKNLEEKVLIFYPGLIEKDSSITYPSNQQLDPDYNLLTKKLIDEADKALQEKNDKILSLLAKKEQYTIQDLLAFYKILDKKKTIFKSKQTKVENKMEVGRDYPVLNLPKEKKAYEYVFDVQKRWDKPWVLSAGVRPLGNKLGLTGWEEEFIEENVFDILTDEGKKKFDIEAPIKTAINPWVGFILGILAPFVIKEGIRRYTRRNWDGYDIFETTISGGTSFMFDMIHPLVFPIRVLALPLISEILGKNPRKR